MGVGAGEYHVVSESLERTRKRTFGKSLFTIPMEESSFWWNLLVIYRGQRTKASKEIFKQVAETLLLLQGP